MRCVSVRRTNLPTAGPGKARVLGPSTINAPNQPICSARYAPSAGAGAALVLPACNTEAMQLHLDEIATKVSPGAHAILILDQAGWHGAKTSRLPKTSRSCRCRRVRQSSTLRKHLAVHAGELAVKPHLQILRRHRQPFCYAWNTLIDQPWNTSMLAVIGQSPVTYCEDWL